MSEIETFYNVCLSEYPESWKTIQRLESYNDEQKKQAAAETAYIQHIGKLPEWGYVIEFAEKHNDAFVFVFADLSTIN